MKKDFISYHDLDPVSQKLNIVSQATPTDLARALHWSLEFTETTVDRMVAAGILQKSYLGGCEIISFPKGTAVYTNKYKPVGIFRPN